MSGAGVGMMKITGNEPAITDVKVASQDVQIFAALMLVCRVSDSGFQLFTASMEH